jgi:hypothetical protein
MKGRIIKLWSQVRSFASISVNFFEAKSSSCTSWSSEGLVKLALLALNLGKIYHFFLVVLQHEVDQGKESLPLVEITILAPNVLGIIGSKTGGIQCWRLECLVVVRPGSLSQDVEHVRFQGNLIASMVDATGISSLFLERETYLVTAVAKPMPA